jgi:hypothetical protein
MSSSTSIHQHDEETPFIVTKFNDGGHRWINIDNAGGCQVAFFFKTEKARFQFIRDICYESVHDAGLVRELQTIISEAQEAEDRAEKGDEQDETGGEE